MSHGSDAVEDRFEVDTDGRRVVDRLPVRLRTVALAGVLTVLAVAGVWEEVVTPDGVVPFWGCPRRSSSTCTTPRWRSRRVTSGSRSPVAPTCAAVTGGVSAGDRSDSRRRRTCWWCGTPRRSARGPSTPSASSRPRRSPTACRRPNRPRGRPSRCRRRSPTVRGRSRATSVTGRGTSRSGRRSTGTGWSP
ncbi:hypothetical protein ACFQRB_06760 [Halobaculum litoreum]|uniref:Uncharacterized protein n=1 Tax=Halobaculum litoreum TaxID=3031998 RepID=A0ABD5XRQ5_9EURY